MEFCLLLRDEFRSSDGHASVCPFTVVPYYLSTKVAEKTCPNLIKGNYSFMPDCNKALTTSFIHVNPECYFHYAV